MSDDRVIRDAEVIDAAAGFVGHCLALKSPEAKIYRRIAHGDHVPDEDLAVLGNTEDRAWAQDVFRPRTPAEDEQELAAIIEAIDREVLEGGRVEREQLARDRARRARWWRWGAVVATAAAVAVAALVLGSPSEPERQHPAIALGTTYRADRLPGVATKRGSGTAGELPEYLPSSTLKLALRPVAAVEGSVEVVGFARGSDGGVRELRLRQNADVNGVVEIMANVRDAGLYEGEWELMFVVGRPTALPRSWEEAEAADASGDSASFDVVSLVRLRVVSSIR